LGSTTRLTCPEEGLYAFSLWGRLRSSVVTPYVQIGECTLRGSTVTGGLAFSSMLYLSKGATVAFGVATEDAEAVGLGEDSRMYVQLFKVK
jgi:hypothetical protein